MVSSFKQGVELKIKKLHPDAIIPKYAHQGDAGFDLCSVSDYHINPGEIVLVKTGLSIALPLGYELQVRPRSGLALKHGITVLNSPGTVDSGYRGEIGVILINHGTEWYRIEKGARIAQGVLAKHETAIFGLVQGDTYLPGTERGSGGFGSSGVS